LVLVVVISQRNLFFERWKDCILVIWLTGSLANPLGRSTFYGAPLWSDDSWNATGWYRRVGLLTNQQWIPGCSSKSCPVWTGLIGRYIRVQLWSSDSSPLFIILQYCSSTSL